MAEGKREKQQEEKNESETENRVEVIQKCREADTDRDGVQRRTVEYTSQNEGSKEKEAVWGK